MKYTFIVLRQTHDYIGEQEEIFFFKKAKQTFGLCGRRRGWDVSREQHRNMYII